MKQSYGTALLIISALFMLFGAAGYAFVVVPDLHGDLVEIGVRPTVLGGTVLYLYFSAIAMFGFALMVSAAAIQAMRGIPPARFPLGVVAVIYAAFGVMAFSRSHNPHHLGALAMGVLLGTALAISRSRRSLT
jgi:DNA-binding LytR/AlgR family response regulator